MEKQHGNHGLLVDPNFSRTEKSGGGGVPALGCGNKRAIICEPLVCFGDCIQAFIREVLAVMIKRSLFKSDDQRVGQREQRREKPHAGY